MALTGHEKIAARNIRGAFNDIIGGWYNSYQDGNIDDIPDMTEEEWKDHIYLEAMNNYYDYGMVSFGRAPKEMRFAGEAFCRKYIDKLWETDNEDILELQEAGKMLPAPKTEVKNKPEEKVSYREKSIEELKKMAEDMNIDFDYNKYTDSRIMRMRLVMAIKKGMMN